MTTANIYNFDPDHISQLIAQSKWEACWTYLSEVIENLTMGANANAMHFNLKLQKDMQIEEQKQYIHNFGGLLAELFIFLLTDVKVEISDKCFYQIICYHEALHSLFYIYDLHDTDELITLILNNRKKLRPNDQKKLLLLLSMNSALDINSILANVERGYKISALVAYMAHRKIYIENVYNNKVKLYELRSDLRHAHEQEKAFMYSVHPYFNCSYLKIPYKNIIKEDLNAAYEAHLGRQAGNFKKLRDTSPLKRYVYDLDPTKPTVMVLNEHFSKNHAMNRGWGKLIKSLLQEFNIILVLQAVNNDPEVAKEYKNILVAESLGDIYAMAYTVKPDILFMPSVGMGILNILISNMRIAPIQIMGLGHPATSMSKYIDYVVSPKGLYDPAAFPKDVYIADGYPEKHSPLVSKETFFADLSKDEIPPRIVDGKKTLYVGVVGTDNKVSYPFFKLLKEIVAESDFNIHISFIMGVGGIDSLYIEKYLRDNFTNFTYYGWRPYGEYLNNLKKMDIVLNSFPFGHTNTIIDTLMCGKPCVGLEDIEPSAKTESDILNAVGLKDHFVAKDETGYKSIFFKYAHKILGDETIFFDRDKVHNRIFAELGDYDYSKVFKWIYENNAKMKEDGKKYYEAFEEI